jgi:hypothetical protein
MWWATSAAAFPRGTRHFPQGGSPRGIVPRPSSLCLWKPVTRRFQPRFLSISPWNRPRPIHTGQGQRSLSSSPPCVRDWERPDTRGSLAPPPLPPPRSSTTAALFLVRCCHLCRHCHLSLRSVVTVTAGDRSWRKGNLRSLGRRTGLH